MNALKTAAICAATTLFATAGWSQAITGGSFELRNSSFDGVSNLDAYGSLSAELGAIGVQLDVGGWKFSTVDTVDFNIGLHIYTDITPDLTVGVVGAIDSWQNYESCTYQSYGVEGKYRPAGSPLTVEAYIGRFGDDACGWNFNLAFIDARYNFTDELYAVAGYRHYDGVYTDNAYSIGAGYNFQNGLTLEATYISLDSHSTIDLTVSYALGSGRMFDFRNWTSMHYGD